MSHDVFISYSYKSRKDQMVAEAICNKFENNRIKCWMAPRNIHPGSDWSDEIIKAIEKCKIFILILSKKTDESKWVKKEVMRALRNNKKIIPFKIDDMDLDSDFLDMIGEIHWLDAIPPDEKHIETLLFEVKSILKPNSENYKYIPLVIVGVILVLILGIFAGGFINGIINQNSTDDQNVHVSHITYKQNSNDKNQKEQDKNNTTTTEENKTPETSEFTDETSKKGASSNST